MSGDEGSNPHGEGEVCYTVEDRAWRLVETSMRSCACQKHLRAGVPSAVTGLKQRHVGLRMRGELMKARLELAFCSCGAVGEKE